MTKAIALFLFMSLLNGCCSVGKIPSEEPQAPVERYREIHSIRN